MNVAPIDIVFVTLALLIALRGALRGFIAELFSLGAIVAAMWAAIAFYDRGARFLIKVGFPSLGFLPEIAAIVLIFLLVFLPIKFLEALLRDLVERLALGTLDRIAGFFFGLAEGLLLVLIILLVLLLQPLFDAEQILSNSFFATKLYPLVPLPSFIPPLAAAVYTLNNHV